MNDWFPADDAEKLALFRADVAAMAEHPGWKIYCARLRAAQSDIADQLGKVTDPTALAKLAGQISLLKSYADWPVQYSKMVGAQLEQLKKEKERGERNRSGGTDGNRNRGW